MLAHHIMVAQDGWARASAFSLMLSYGHPLTGRSMSSLRSFYLLLLLLPSLCGGTAVPPIHKLGVRDSIMIAHSFNGPQFGPAQELHGATYTVDVEFKTHALVPKLNWVVDIGEASDVLGKILKKYNFKNLDEVFPGENTTTEFMCKVIHEDLRRHFCGGPSPFKGSICVKLWESHKAWACYEAST